MGSAALFRRRTIPLSLLVVAGVLLIAISFGLPDGEPPLLRSQALSGDGGVTSVAANFSTGWQIPDLSDTDDHHHSSAEAPAEAGAETIGAAVDVVDGATIALVNAQGSGAIAVRVESGGRWSDWDHLTIGGEEGPDAVDGEGANGQTPVVGPLWLGDNSQQLEVVVISGPATQADIIFLGPTAEDREDDEVFEPASASASGGGTVDRPAIMTREQWATGSWDYQNESCEDGPSVADHIQAVVIHHTVTANTYGEADVDDIIRAIYYGHVVINGWCDVGYNFIVDRFGRIWEARTDSIDSAVIGGHARGFNTSTVGVAMLGQHHPGSSPTAAEPSKATADAVEALAHWKLGIHGVDPAGYTWLRNRSTRQPLKLAGDSWHYVPTILGHRDLGITSCPGNHGYSVVAGLAARLAARRDVTVPYSFVEWQAHTHGPGFVIAESGGGLRPAGTAKPWTQAPPELSGADRIIAVGGTAEGGYLLRAQGSLVEFGTAPVVSEVPASGATAVDLQVRSDRSSGWVLGQGGTLHGFGGVGDLAPNLGAAGGPVVAVAVALDDGGNGYVADALGRLFPVGSVSAIGIGSSLGDGVGAVDVDLKPTPASGGWLLDDRGFIHEFGPDVSADQAPHRVFPPEAVRAVISAIVGQGGWVLDADGQLWPFGGARHIFPVSTNASAANAVDADHIGSEYQQRFLDGDDATFVSSVHQLFLGQNPSVETLDLLVTDLEQGSDRVDLTTDLARSENWSGNSLDQMYRDVLGREPDSDGRAYWIGQIAAGLNLQDLGTYFYGSQEYATGSGSTSAYVTGLYNALLRREPDSEGLSYWVDLLDSGRATPPDVANGFYASVESRRDRASRLHQQIFGSPPTGEERDYWADRLLVVGDAGVAAELAASSDYYDLTTQGTNP